MKKIIWGIVVSLFLFSSICSAAGKADLIKELKKAIDANPVASSEVKKFAKSNLISLCSNKVFVAGIKKQNAKKVSLKKIQEIDEEWKDAEDELDIHAQLLNNSVAKEIKKIAKTYTAIGETFVMDNQGANVGQNELTSDYWQGDEAKWKKTFNKGKGGVEVGKTKLDASSGMVLQQVSLPVFTEKGKVVGAVTFGLITNKI